MQHIDAFSIFFFPYHEQKTKIDCKHGLDRND